jgi:hypothetical protein
VSGVRRTQCTVVILSDPLPSQQGLNCALLASNHNCRFHRLKFRGYSTVELINDEFKIKKTKVRH